MTEGISHIQSIALEATPAAWYSKLHFSPFHHIRKLWYSQQSFTSGCNSNVPNDKIMSFSAYLSFSNILCLFVLLHYDLGLGLIFPVFFSGIYGMCWRFYLHKEAFVGDFVGLLSILLHLHWHPLLLILLWNRLMMHCRQLKGAPWRIRGINPRHHSASRYILCFRQERW